MVFAGDRMKHSQDEGRKKDLIMHGKDSLFFG